jgi:hypothetical protein
LASIYSRGGEIDPGQSALPATARAIIRNAMTLIDFTNPTGFPVLTGRILPWFAAPTEIMFIREPNGWLRALQMQAGRPSA